MKVERKQIEIKCRSQIVCGQHYAHNTLHSNEFNLLRNLEEHTNEHIKKTAPTTLFSMNVINCLSFII